MDRRLVGFERGVALNQGAEINLQSLAGLKPPHHFFSKALT